MNSLVRIYLFKIAGTAIFWCVRLLLFPPSFFAKLGIVLPTGLERFSALLPNLGLHGAAISSSRLKHVARYARIDAPSAQRGLTLAEIMISLALLASLTVVVVGLFSKMLSSGGKQADQGVARRLADKVLTKAVRQGPPGWGGSGPNYEATVALTSGRSDLTTEYTYRVQVDDVRSTDLGDLKRVQVQIQWWPNATDGNDMKMERGRLSLNVDQLVYTGK